MRRVVDIIEARLREARASRQRLRFWRNIATIGCIVCITFLLLAAAIINGWVAQRSPVMTTVALIVLGTFIAVLALIVIVAASPPKRGELAAALERTQPRMLDRLNTLVALEKDRQAYPLGSYLRRVEKQVQGELFAAPPGNAFSPKQSLAHFGVFALLLVTTIHVYRRYDPWDQLRVALPAIKPSPVGEFALPDARTVEQTKHWGEVRISDPGHDMRVTKVDAVSLQIEAASDQDLKTVDWRSAINGESEQSHALPPPAEPRYAIYQPVLYVDEFKLADWDVLTYYANAYADTIYASDVYFLEVRPFREDILKLPGGEGGKCYQLLSELTALINRQQYVIRETYRFAQRPPDKPEIERQDREKLSEAETDLAGSARHLYARIANELENQPVGEVLDHLAHAQEQLTDAADNLDRNAMPAAQGKERSALTELVATRKTFQKFITDNPGAFKNSEDEEPTPVAEVAGKLKQIEEFRNESKAAEDFVKKAQARQQGIAQRSATTNRTEQSNLAEEESALAKSLDEFQQQHPQPFRDVTNETSQAQKAIGDAEQALRKKKPGSVPDMAAEKLRQLHDAMQDQSLSRQLTDAYKLKQLLDDQISQCRQLTETPSALSSGQIDRMTADAKATTSQLKNFADQPPTSEAFGPPLRGALTTAQKQALDSKLDALAKAEGDDTTKKAAGEAGDALGIISKAFEASEPPTLQQARKSDALKDDASDALERGLSKLRSLLTQLENNHDVPDEDRRKQQREAFGLLQSGVLELHGDDDRTKKLVLLIEQDLKDTKPLDPITLKKLMDEIRNFSVEVADSRPLKPDEPEMTHIDPSQLPPAYRDRIQRYFKKLSEQ